MPAPIIPWQPSNIPSEIQSELNRRKINRSFKYINNNQANWNSNDGDWNTYRGPMTSWIRVCSNSAGHPDEDNKTFSRQRFVLHSGKGFYQSYGFSPPNNNTNGSKYQVIGYMPGNKTGQNIDPHIIENNLNQPSDEPVNFPIHVPPPEISRMEVTVQKELFRRVQIEWVCFSWKQLVYMTPYFLVPGITCIVEWGWNHFNPESLVNLGDTAQLRQYWDNAYPLYFDNIVRSKGNYDVLFGIITNFNWSIEGNKIICSTEITSKDRLYSGIAKDYGLSVTRQKAVKTKAHADDTTNESETTGLFQSIYNFLNEDDTIKTLRQLVENPNVSNEVVSLVRKGTTPQEKMWYDILNPLLTIGTTQQKGMRTPWVFGLFAGRNEDMVKRFGKAKQNDFDSALEDNDPANIWINMGMVTAIINHFSALDSGANLGNNMFEVDIQNSLVSGHPNLISCDTRVLIPNYQAPKYCYGEIGIADNTPGISLNPKYPYSQQIATPTQVGDSPANKKLNQIFKQLGNNCYRNDLDQVINYNRYKYVTTSIGGAVSYSFPAKFNSTPLPKSIRGLNGNEVEKDLSGLLSNIYISFELLMEAVNDSSNASYFDIFNHIIRVLNISSDGFWELALTDVENVLTIADKKFVGKYALKNTIDAQGNIQGPEKVYSFDYYDADSIIKSLKFRPQLADAQATRTIYGEVNNKNSKFKYMDKNDVLDYVFRDAVIGTPEDKTQGDSQSTLGRSKTAEDQLNDMVRLVQQINGPSNDGTLQMSLSFNGDTDKVEIIKLVLPVAQLLRLLLNDDDDIDNARYCAVQPNIILELTLQGVGGLRTFQYFTIKNFPEPYSDRNIIFRITDVHQTLEAGNWETTIRAQPLPLRGYIKQRLVGPLGFSAPNNGWPPNPKP